LEDAAKEGAVIMTAPAASAEANIVRPRCLLITRLSGSSSEKP